MIYIQDVLCHCGVCVCVCVYNDIYFANDDTLLSAKSISSSSFCCDRDKIGKGTLARFIRWKVNPCFQLKHTTAVWVIYPIEETALSMRTRSVRLLLPLLYLFITFVCCANGLIDRLYCGKYNCYEGKNQCLSGFGHDWVRHCSSVSLQYSVLWAQQMR